MSIAMPQAATDHIRPSAWRKRQQRLFGQRPAAEPGALQFATVEPVATPPEANFRAPGATLGDGRFGVAVTSVIDPTGRRADSSEHKSLPALQPLLGIDQNTPGQRQYPARVHGFQFDALDPSRRGLRLNHPGNHEVLLLAMRGSRCPLAEQQLFRVQATSSR